MERDPNADALSGRHSQRMHATLAAISAAQGGPFTAAQAMECGYSRQEIRQHLANHRWCRLRRGVYIDAALFADRPARERHVLMMRGLMIALGRPAFASHVSAVAIRGYALLTPDLEMLHVTRTAPMLASRTEAGVHHHAATLRDDEISVAQGIPVTVAARTVVDYAREATFRQGVVTADSALFAHAVTLADLRSVLAAQADWPGARNASHVVSFAATGAASVGESVARIVFAENGLPTPELQVPIYDDAGLVGVVDFLWRIHRTIGEFDGRIKYGETERAASDAIYAEKRREDRLRALGFEVVRFGWPETTKFPKRLCSAMRAAFSRADARATLAS